jgi:hypothetical protein
MKKQFLSWLAVATMFFFAFACSDDERNAKLQVWLTDAAGDYDVVNIDVQGVEVHSSENDNGNGWIALDVNEGVYDVRKLVNGLDTILGTVEIPAGKISQIRLILGDNNSVVVDGQTHDLTIPSGQQSGLKLQVHETLTAGITYKILLDFDVARSIVKMGSGQYHLKPVIRAFSEAQDGAIKGLVDPKESTPAVYAIIGEDTLGTSYADTTGHFLIRGLQAGSYTVSFAPNSNYQPTSKTGVSVSVGSVTDVGTVTIEQ